jgi:calcium-dependent protein kinase
MTDKEKEKKPKGFSKSNFVGIMKGNLLDKYTVEKEIGAGGYARCLLVKNKTTGQLYACKELQKNKLNNVASLKSEIQILIKLDHPNIIKLYEIYENDNYIYLVMELCTGGELFDRIIQKTEQGKQFTEKEVANIFQQMMSAINYCHSNKIVHRDLKPENLLLATQDENSPIKVIDFGMSRIFNNKQAMFDKVGTAYYISPEVLDGFYDEKCDIWSAGVILYILLCGYPPFNGNDDDEIFESIKKRKFVFPDAEWANISKEAKDLINKMLSDPLTRLTAEQVLGHPWLVNQLNKNTKAKEIKINFNTFKTYSGANKLSRAVLTYIASRLTDDEVKKLKDAFQKIDVNGDGMLTLDELKNAISQNPEVHVMNIEQIFKTIDTDNSGVINYTEFLAASIDKRIYLQEDKLRDAFKLFDEDKSGKISKSEISKVLKFKKSGAEMTKLFEKYDLNGDGEIDFDEFLNMMKDL